MRIWPIAAAAVSSVLVAGGAVGADRLAGGDAGADAAPDRAASTAAVRAGVVLNSLENAFFVAIYEGTRAEARRLGVRTTVRSVTSNEEEAQQAAQVRASVAGDEDCYVVNPITATNLVPPLRGVRRPIVNVDSPVDPEAAERAGVRVTTYVGTDDFAGGRLAGRRMTELLPRGGEVALIGGVPGNINTGLRLDGFERALRGTSVSVVARVNADYDRTKAQIAAERLLRTHPGLDGFFTASDAMGLGTADAVRAAGRTGEVRVVSLDGIADALDAVRSGAIDATVSQYPYVMGRMVIEACAAAARGATLPARVDAPIALITRANVDRAIAAFPEPFRPYRDPYRSLARGG